MTHHNHANEYMVHGVSCEMLRGNEDTIYSPAWFVDVNGSYFWSFEKSWTRESLREIKKGEDVFIYFLKESERVPLNEGELVYLAGEEFMTKVLSFIEAGEIDLSVSDWKQISNGYYIATMPSAVFSAYAERLSLDLWAIVEKFLVDGNAELKDMATDAFDAYTAIAYYSAEDKKEQSLRRAMFYMLLGDANMLELETRLSVEFDQFFDTTELFRSAVEQRLDALQQ
jgi:hypothetical protein